MLKASKKRRVEIGSPSKTFPAIPRGKIVNGAKKSKEGMRTRHPIMRTSMNLKKMSKDL